MISCSIDQKKEMSIDTAFQKDPQKRFLSRMCQGQGYRSHVYSAVSYSSHKPIQ